MPLPLILLLLGAGAATATLLYCWSDVCEWFANHVNPWLKTHVPQLQPFLERAFMYIDEHVASPLRKLAIDAWRKVRPYLLQAVVEFEKRHDNVWVRRITSLVKRHLQDRQAVRRVEEVIVDWSSLPQDVRDRHVRGQAQSRTDIVSLRDKEMEKLVLVT